MLTIQVSGRLTRDSSVKFTPSGAPLLAFDVATDCGWGDKKHPVYVKCTLWGKQAESLAPYLLKGHPVVVSGKGDLHTWESDKGNGAAITLNVDEIDPFIGGRSESGNKPEPAKQSGFRSPTDNVPHGQPPAMDDFDDSDVPF